MAAATNGISKEGDYKMKYKRYVSILNLQWKYTWKAFTAILVFMFIGQGYFLYKELTNAVFEKEIHNGVTQAVEPWAMRFEEFLARSHMEGIFIIAMILTVLLLISVPIRQRSVSMVEYSYMRLPVRKGTWQVMTLVHGITHFLILLGAQFGIIIISYQMYLKFVPEEAQMTQALFLAFIRWDFLLAIFPITDIFRLLYFVVILISLAVIVFYLPICIQKRHKSIFPFLICGYYYIDLTTQRGISTIILSSILLIAAMIFMIYMGRELLNQD